MLFPLPDIFAVFAPKGAVVRLCHDTPLLHILLYTTFSTINQRGRGGEQDSHLQVPNISIFNSMYFYVIWVWYLFNCMSIYIFLSIWVWCLSLIKIILCVFIWWLCHDTVLHRENAVAFVIYPIKVNFKKQVKNHKPYQLG